MKKDSCNHTRWKHKSVGTTAGVSGTKWLLNWPEMRTEHITRRTTDAHFSHVSTRDSCAKLFTNACDVGSSS